jgi:H+/Cl- antiporter ClcA
LPKSFLTEYRLELGSMFLLLFCLLTIIGVVGVFFDDGLPSYLMFLTDLTEPTGSWAYWFLVIGPLGAVVSAWWLYDYVKKSRKLADLIKTPSKAKFVRNLDDIEYLAWSLPRRFEKEVLKKKRDFGL